MVEFPSEDYLVARSDRNMQSRYAYNDKDVNPLASIHFTTAFVAVIILGRTRHLAISLGLAPRGSTEPPPGPHMSCRSFLACRTSVTFQWLMSMASLLFLSYKQLFRDWI
jgi:hypothetical protein